MTIQRLRELINQTHQHGLKLAEEIRALQAKHKTSAYIKAGILRARLIGLEALNRRRRAELAKLEHKKPAPKPAPKPTPKPKPAPPKPQRFRMYDSTVVSHIPKGAVAVAGYVNGIFANFDEMVRAFPKAKHLSISIDAEGDADALDVENGDATPAQAPGWVRKQHARGLRLPVVYANASTMPAVIKALEDDDIKSDEYILWVADYDGIAEIPAGFGAKQYEDHGELYDVSICEPWFL